MVFALSASRLPVNLSALFHSHSLMIFLKYLKRGADVGDVFIDGFVFDDGLGAELQGREAVEVEQEAVFDQVFDGFVARHIGVGTLGGEVGPLEGIERCGIAIGVLDEDAVQGAVAVDDAEDAGQVNITRAEGHAHAVDGVVERDEELIFDVGGEGAGREAFGGLLGFAIDDEVIAGVQARAEKRMVDLFDEFEQFGGGDVFVVFKGDAHAELLGQGQAGVEVAPGVVEGFLEVVLKDEQGAKDVGADVGAQAQLPVEHVRAGASAADFDEEALLFKGVAHAPDVGAIGGIAAEEAPVGAVDVDLEAGESQGFHAVEGLEDVVGASGKGDVERVGVQADFHEGLREWVGFGAAKIPWILAKTQRSQREAIFCARIWDGCWIAMQADYAQCKRSAISFPIPTSPKIKDCQLGSIIERFFGKTREIQGFSER